MLKISTRIFAASAMAAMLIGINSGAFACDNCAEVKGAKTTKVAAKKPVAKTIASAKIAPKSKVAQVKSAPKIGAKLASLTTKSAKAEAPMCAMCEAETANKK